MSNQTQWLIQVQTKFPNFITDYNKCWYNILIEVFEELAAKTNTQQVKGLNGLKKYCRKYFPYVKHEKQYESIAEKVAKDFVANMDTTMFDDYRSHFPLLFDPAKKEKKEYPKNKQTPTVKKPQVKVTDFTSDTHICYPFNITTTHNSVNFTINDLNSDQTKFMYNHIVEGVNSLPSVKARVL